MNDEAPTLGILVLEGKMADVPGCMVCPDTFPYPVTRKVVPGAATPRTPEDAEALLPNYIETAQQLEQEGVAAITANCGLMALLQDELADSVGVPVVLSSLLAVPTVARMRGSGQRVGILTFYEDAVGEANFRASGWSRDTYPVSVAGVSQYDSWQEFLRTKEMDEELRAQAGRDLLVTIEGLLARERDIGALVSECTLLPAVIQDLREEVPVPIYDILTVLDWAVSGFHRPAGRPRAVSHVA